jgi:hypothetical protein
MTGETRRESCTESHPLLCHKRIDYMKSKLVINYYTPLFVHMISGVGCCVFLVDEPSSLATISK